MNDAAIVALDVATDDAPLDSPLTVGATTVRSRRLVVVRVRDEAGRFGYGEGSPIEWMDDTSAEEVRARIESATAAIVGRSTAEALRGAALAEFTEDQSGLAARSAVEQAVFDLAARRMGRPLAGLLAEPQSGASVTVPAITVARLVSAEDPADAARFAAASAKRGFEVFKLKVSDEDFDRSLARVAAVRASVGGAARLRLDANGCWPAEDSERRLREVARFNIDFVEEPSRELDRAAWAGAAKASGVALAADESLARDEDLDAVIDSASASVVVLKLVRSGGPSRALLTAAKALAAGLRVVVTDSIDGPVGSGAAVHTAAAVAMLAGDRAAEAVGLGGLAVGLRPRRVDAGLSFEDDAASLAASGPGLDTSANP